MFVKPVLWTGKHLVGTVAVILSHISGTVVNDG